MFYCELVVIALILLCVFTSFEIHKFIEFVCGSRYKKQIASVEPKTILPATQPVTVATAAKLAPKRTAPHTKKAVSVPQRPKTQHKSTNRKK